MNTPRPPNERRRRARGGGAIALSALLVLAGCRSGAPDAGGAPAAPEAGADEVPVQVALAASDLAVGRQRFAFAILDGDGALVPGATAEVTFFRLEGDEARPAGAGEAAFYPAQLEQAGLYVVYTTFEAAGPWGALIDARLPDGRRAIPQRIRFDVADAPRSPGVGDRPPPTDNRTLEDVSALAELTSDPAPEPGLYRMTVDEAVAAGRPAVVLFATPAYCQSRICGPVIDEIKAAREAWGERVSFIHIEVYQQFDPLVYADEMADWGLETEPWVFVLDAEGRVAERLEGSVTLAELEPILSRVTGDRPE